MILFSKLLKCQLKIPMCPNTFLNLPNNASGEHSFLLWSMNEFNLQQNEKNLFTRTYQKRPLTFLKYTSAYSVLDYYTGSIHNRLFSSNALFFKFLQLKNFLSHIQVKLLKHRFIYVCGGRRWFTCIYYFATLTSQNYSLGWWFGLYANQGSVLPYLQQLRRAHFYGFDGAVPAVALFIDSSTRLMRSAIQELRGCLIVNLFSPTDRFISPLFIPWTKTESSVWLFLYWVTLSFSLLNISTPKHVTLV